MSAFREDQTAIGRRLSSGYRRDPKGEVGQVTDPGTLMWTWAPGDRLRLLSVYLLQLIPKYLIPNNLALFTISCLEAFFIYLVDTEVLETT